MLNSSQRYKIITITSISIFVLAIAAVGILFLRKDKLFTNKSFENQVANQEETKQDTPTKGAPAIDDTDHILGNKNAPIQFVVYSDFECPVCQQYEDTIKKVRDFFGDKVVIVFRHYPLRMHDNALPAAIASECAADQGKFWEMHDQLFLDNMAGELSNEKYIENAKIIGLEVVKFAQCLHENSHRNEILVEMGNGKLAGVNGTPATFINNQVLPGAYQFEDFTDSRGDKRKGLKSIIQEKLDNVNNL